MPELTPPDQIEPASLDDYLEVMSKAVFQSGMSWRVVESKWPGIRDAFLNFDARKVADFSVFELEELANDKRVIRNRRKLAAIVNNAQKMIELERDHGSFRSYLRSHSDFDATVAALRNDFKFMGPTGCYYFLYVVGEDVPPHEEFRAAYRK
jgi:3-methyladenine DNA glycosylase Tag